MNKLKQLRTERNMTQQALADASDVFVTQIQRLETGIIHIDRITLSTAVKLAKALGVTAEDLMEDNMTYFIADNDGNIYAHDIESRAKAEAIMADIISELGETPDGLEIMEESK